MDKFLSLLIFWLQLDCVSSKQEVNQSPEVLTVKEGDSVFLNCSYTDSNIYFLQWYRQDPGKGLTFLSIQLSPGVQETGRIKAFFDKTSRHSALHIASAQLSDSATYLCAVLAGNQKLYFGRGTSLTVIPNIQNATPAVYQLENRKSNTPICLFTDFDSNINVSDVLNDTVISSKNTVVDMKATNSKSNGVLFWSNTAKSGCEGISEEITYYTSEGIPCDAKLIEKGFETDMNLNSQNLSVIALRILLLKVVGFNLLMTLRLWSS